LNTGSARAEPVAPHAGDTVLRLREALRTTVESPRELEPVELLPDDRGRLFSAEALAALHPAAVLVPLIEHPGDWTVLLTRRADTLRHHQGQVSFPGGKRDADDADLTAAALREAQEEVGLDPSRVEVIGFLNDVPTLTGYRITPVVGCIRGPFAPTTDPGEVAAAFELPLAELLREDAFRMHFIERDGVELPYYELVFGEHRIWGATAAILLELSGKLRG